MAVSLAAELVRHWGGQSSGPSLTKVVLIPSGNGVFDVALDGKLLFSKHAVKRHAEDGEVVSLIRKALGR